MTGTEKLRKENQALRKEILRSRESTEANH